MMSLEPLFLKIATTFANFIVFGTIPVDKDKFMICTKGDIIPRAANG